jgi:hypothetical protein
MKGMNPYMKMQLRLARTAEFQGTDWCSNHFRGWLQVGTGGEE